MPIDKDTVVVQQGWNLIGGSSVDLPVLSLRTEPENLIISNIYGFDDSYKQVDTIKPTKGYWLKVNGSGKIFFGATQPIMKSTHSNELPESQNKIDINFDDNRGHQQQLSIVNGSISEDQFEFTLLPPIPPSDVFDVRFNSDRYMEILGEAGEERFPIVLQSSHYPVTVSVPQGISDVDQFIFDGIQEKKLVSGNSLTINQPSASLYLLIRSKTNSEQPKNFELSQNYPNPFNPSTKIQYKLPSQSKVKIIVYDLQGREVALLGDEIKQPGTYNIEWRPELSSGIYYCQITAIDLQEPKNSFYKTIKLTLLR
jgi:hypothetical protein